MNAMLGVAGETETAIPKSIPAPRQYTLRRSGRKAVRFDGWQLIEAKAAGETDTISYDLAIYRSDANAIIVELIARRGILDEQDLSRVEVFPDLAVAATWLESYGVGNDVPIDAALSADEASVVSSVLKAIQLRQRIARIEDDYHGLLSDVFDALGITDSPSSGAPISHHETAPEDET